MVATAGTSVEPRPGILDAVSLLAEVADELVVSTVRDTHLAWLDGSRAGSAGRSGAWTSTDCTELSPPTSSSAVASPAKAKRGVKVTVTCSLACQAKATLTVSKKVAKMLQRTSRILGVTIPAADLCRQPKEPQPAI